GMNDLRFALRQLVKNPGFTAVAVLTLALGIGANTAIFSFVNAILLQTLPFKDPDRLVMVFTSYLQNGSHKNWVAAPTLNEWRKQSTVFEGLAARSFDGFVLTGRGQPENIPGSRFSANIFRLLRIQRGEVFRTYQQQCWGFMSLVVRTQRDPAEITRLVRSELDTIDKDQPIENVHTMTQLVASSVGQRRLSVQLLAGFSGVALLLAA